MIGSFKDRVVAHYASQNASAFFFSLFDRMPTSDELLLVFVATRINNEYLRISKTNMNKIRKILESEIKKEIKACSPKCSFLDTIAIMRVQRDYGETSTGFLSDFQMKVLPSLST